MVVVLEKPNKFSESYSCPLSARNNYYIEFNRYIYGLVN